MALLAFSDTTNKNGVIQRCEIALGLTDGAISGNATLLKQFTGLINSAYQKVITMILTSQDDWKWDDIGTTNGTTATRANFPTATFPLTSSRDITWGVGEQVLVVNRVDITYDGVNWYRAAPLDAAEAEQGFGNDTITDSYFSKTNPRYDLQANGFWLYPMASATDVVNGASGRIEFIRQPSEFVSTDTTKTLGIDTPFQPLVHLTASADWAAPNAPGLYPTLQGQADNLEARMRVYYGRKDEDRAYYAKMRDDIIYS